MRTIDRVSRYILWVAIARRSCGRCLVGAVSLTLLVAACGRHEAVPSPTSTGPTTPSLPTAPTLILSGVVTEDGRPIENVQVDVSGSQSCSSGCTSRQFVAGSG